MLKYFVMIFIFAFSIQVNVCVCVCSSVFFSNSKGIKKETKKLYEKRPKNMLNNVWLKVYML